MISSRYFSLHRALGQQYSALQIVFGSFPKRTLQNGISARHLSTSFREMYRESSDSAPLIRGDILEGRLVGSRRPRATSSRFYVVDFGLKSEAPFTAQEIPGSSVVGDKVSLAIMNLEDDFNEPVFDHDRRSELSALQAQRYDLLTKAAANDFRFLHGRFAGFKKGGASVKALGADSFSPRHHVVALDRPILGSYAPFYVMSVTTRKKMGAVGLEVNPIVSSYGGFLFCLANLVGIDSAWEKSGKGSSKERVAYLRLLTRLLYHKNAAVRRILPKHSPRNAYSAKKFESSKLKHLTEEEAAWLKDLPKRNWKMNATDRRDANKSWRQRRPPMLQKASVDNGQSRTNRMRNPRSRTDSRPTRSASGNNE